MRALRYLQHACVELDVQTPPMHSTRGWNSLHSIAPVATHGQPGVVGSVAQSGGPPSGLGWHGPSWYSIHTPRQHWYVGVQQK